MYACTCICLSFTTETLKLNEEIATLAQSFESLQTIVFNELNLTKMDVKHLREAVLGVYRNKAIPRSIMTEIQAALCSRDLFTVITRHGMWSYINHHLLECMVEKVVPQHGHLQKEITMYKMNVMKFVKKTPISDYIDTCFQIASGKIANVMPVHVFPPDPAMFVLLQLTVKLHSRNQCLDIILQLQNHVMKHFSLPHPTLLLGAVSRGSIVISFHFPRAELKRVCSLAGKSGGFFTELNVESVTIDNQHIKTLTLLTHEVF